MAPHRSLIALATFAAASLVVQPATAKAKDKRPPAGSRSGWQAVITAPDRDRLRGWRAAWIDGLTQARAQGFAAEIAREGALLDPDTGQADPAVPDGPYRCRIIKLGRKIGLGKAYTVLPAAACSVHDHRFTVDGGVQRPGGRLWEYDGARYIFLGSIAVGDERASIPYGRDRERDSLGLFERYGKARWRLALPHPTWESVTDIVEIEPAG